MRFIATNINALAGTHFCAPRRRATVRLKLAIVDSNPHVREPRTVTFDGYTWDISATGLAIMLPLARFSEQLLNQGQRTLRVVLQLATGAVEADAALVRYELLQIDDGFAEVGCLLGAQILSMRPEDRERFNEHLRSIE